MWLDSQTVEDTAYRTGIVIPVKDEDLLTLENVIAATPHASTVIIASASSRKPVDKYAREVEVAKAIHAATGRRVVAFHQRDPRVG